MRFANRLLQETCNPCESQPDSDRREAASLARTRIMSAIATGGRSRDSLGTVLRYITVPEFTVENSGHVVARH